MKSRLFVLGLTCMVSVGALAQSIPRVPSDELELLKRVAQRYADAKSYRIEAVKDETSYNDLHRGWQKSIMEAAQGPAGRFHYEGHSGFGSAARISNGSYIWDYRIDGKVYTKTAVTSKGSDGAQIIGPSEMSMWNAQNMRRDLAEIAKHLKSATRLPDTELEVNGRRVACYEVNFQTGDVKSGNPDYTFDKTVWIDKANELFIKIEERAHTMMFNGAAQIPITTETSTTYSSTQLDRPIPDSVFTLIAPQEAKLVDRFPDPGNGGPSIAGQMIPEFNLKTGDGKTIAITALRGKPVLLDVWATWCAPCVKGLDQLVALYHETKGMDLVIMTVDRDGDPKAATEMLREKGCPWPNVHDDGEISKAIGGVAGVPRQILIDSEGKVIYDKISSGNDNEIRAAIASLGPKYATLAPKGESPCGTQISSK